MNHNMVRLNKQQRFLIDIFLHDLSFKDKDDYRIIKICENINIIKYVDKLNLVLSYSFSKGLFEEYLDSIYQKIC